MSRFRVKLNEKNEALSYQIVNGYLGQLGKIIEYPSHSQANEKAILFGGTVEEVK